MPQHKLTPNLLQGVEKTAEVTDLALFNKALDILARIAIGIFSFFSGVIAQIDNNWPQLISALLLLAVVALPIRIAPRMTWKLRSALSVILFLLIVLFDKAT